MAAFPNITSNVSNISKPLITDAILLPVGLVLVMENIIAIFILYRCTRLNFQIRLLSINLALTDLLTGVMSCMPLELLTFGDGNCEFKKYLSFLFVNTSLLTITMFNLDRCFVFWFAMRYYTFITKKIISKLCVMTWFTSFVITYLMFFNYHGPLGIQCGFMYEQEKNTVNNTGKSVILLLILSNLVMYGYILFYFKRKMKTIFDVNSMGSQTPGNQSQVVIKLSVITGTFLAMFTPFIITLTFPILDYSKSSGKLVHNSTAVLMVLNSAANPVLYVWRFKEPRYHLKRLFCFFNSSYLRNQATIYNQEIACYSLNSKTLASNP